MRAIVALVALLLLSGQGLDPLAPSNAEKSNAAAAPAPAVESVTGTPDPLGTTPSNPPAAGSAPIGTVSPAGPGPAAAPGATKSKDAKAKTGAAAAAKPEVLPWANAPKAVPGAAGAPASAADAKAAAASPCNGLFEAGCREQKKACAWIADMKAEDGTLVPGRCAPRAQGAVKKAQAAKPKPKPAAAPAAPATAAPPAADAAPAPASPVTITVNPPKTPAEDPAAAEGIPAPATE